MAPTFGQEPPTAGLLLWFQRQPVEDRRDSWGDPENADIGTAPGSYGPNQFVALSTGALFVGRSGAGGELWLTDGNTATRVTNSFPTAAMPWPLTACSRSARRQFSESPLRAAPRLRNLGDRRNLGRHPKLKASVTLQPLTFMARFAGHAVFTAKTATAVAISGRRTALKAEHWH